MLNVIISWEGMGSKMICPLMSRPTHDFRDGLNKVFCLEEKCAWWNGEYEVCSVPMLAITVIERGSARNA